MPKDTKFGILNFLVLLFSILALCGLIADTFLDLTPEIKKILKYFDYMLCAFFLGEFIYQLLKAENKYEYIKWGWIDLLSSIPMIDSLRYGRIIRIVRIIRIIKTFKSINEFLKHIYFNKARGTLASVFVLAIMILVFSSIAILLVETSEKSNIKTAEDALWWAYTTITTVGYGDKFPVTSEGRVIAIFLMTFGVGMFGTMTAYISSLFIKKN